MNLNTSTDCWVAYTTVNSKSKATGLARKLVENKYVACVNIVGPVESVYWWEGQVEQSNEWMLMMKCSKKQADQLKTTLPDLHDYDVPELIVLPIADGHEPYLDWIRRSAGGL